MPDWGLLISFAIQMVTIKFNVMGAGPWGRGGSEMGNLIINILTGHNHIKCQSLTFRENNRCQCKKKDTFTAEDAHVPLIYSRAIGNKF